ncbi:MAG: hypothetical protein ACJ780_24385 [Solirubrobacteraceae bacterium]
MTASGWAGLGGEAPGQNEGEASSDLAEGRSRSAARPWRLAHLSLASPRWLLGGVAVEQRRGGGDECVERDRQVSLAIGGQRGSRGVQCCGQLFGALEGGAFAL